MFAALQASSVQAFPNAVQVQPGKTIHSQPTRVFGSLEFKANKVQGTEQWQRVLKRIAGEASIYAACDSPAADCHGKVRAWRKSMRTLSKYQGWDLLAAVNGKINQLIDYRDDIDSYGRLDHWASPREALTGFGDCEDYAILKYISLLELGIDDSQMRIVVVTDLKRGIGHAVLAVNLNGKTYILDSLKQRPALHTKVSHYVPHYSVNRQGGWLNIAARKRNPQIAKRKTIKIGFKRPVVIARPKPARLAQMAYGLRGSVADPALERDSELQ